MFMSIFMVTLLIIGVIWCVIWFFFTIKELYFTGNKWYPKL